MNTIPSKMLAVLATALLLAGAAQGQSTTNANYTFNVSSGLIPVGSPIGFDVSTNLAGLPGTIRTVQVALDITGGFNGDLYAYLTGPGGSVVLLNRPGLTGSNPTGYADTGFNITLSDSAANNIHNYQADSPAINGSGQLTGTWAPDGRTLDPQSPGSTFDATTPSSALSALNNSSPDGTWTLFIADLSAGSGQATLVSWGLTVVTVPEPQIWILVAGGMGLLLAVNRRRKL